MKRTYTIIGATGKTGMPIASGLLNDGNEVRIVVRDAAKAIPLTDRGAILFQGEVTDAALLKRALTGADAAYVMIPQSYATADIIGDQVRVADTIATALRDAHVRHVVTLSSIGAHLASGAGMVAGLRHMEQVLDGVEGLNTRHLRSAYFMENAMAFAGMAKHMGMIGSSIADATQVPMVAARDVAARALQRLRALDFAGHSTEYVLGPRELTYGEVVSVLGRTIGRSDLRYQQFPYDQAEQGMMQMGFSASAASNMNQFVKSLNEGRVLEDARKHPQELATTSIEEFAPAWKAVYEMS